VIYGPNATLPTDWTTRAKAALQDAPLDDVPIADSFRPRNLFPFVALLALALALGSTVRADAGADAYAKGDFSGAESLWRKAVAASPKDAHAHYNLSLALAQQDRWSESAGEALSAFLLDPRDASIRWQFNLSLDRSGIDYPVFTGLVHGDGFYRVARVLSPAAWELLICVASVIFALAGALYLFQAYRGTLSRGLRRLYGAVAILALLLAVSCAYSLHLYGPLSQRDIVFVSQGTLLQTIPNATDTLQKTSPLVAGTLTHATREFLGWSQVRFANGQTGWVRTDLLISLYN
jgi:tetratricopeptide (TPR) repeat protein